MADEKEAAERKNQHRSVDNNSRAEQEPSDAWIWIIASMLLLIAVFFALGGSKLLGDQGSAPMEPNATTQSISSLSNFSQNP